MINKERVFENGKDNIEYEDNELISEEASKILAVKRAIQTKISKNNYSVYVNTPSIEIKKWFQTRRI